MLFRSPAAAVPLARSVTLSVYTKKAVPVEDLKPEEIVLSEGGRKRSVLGVERDTRPLDVALVIDTSGALAAAYRSDLVPAVIDFWKALPAGSGIAVWSTAPAKVAEFGAEVTAADSKLRMIAAAGGNYGFDSMVEGCKDLGARGAARRYSPGESPAISRNSRTRWAWSLYPAANATSDHGPPAAARASASCSRSTRQ